MTKIKYCFSSERGGKKGREGSGKRDRETL